MLDHTSSIYDIKSLLNCYPSFAQFLDIYQIDQDDADDFVFQWVQNLLDHQSLELESKVSFTVHEQLNSLFFGNRNHLRTKGASITSFGFPIFGSVINQQTIYAPLLIWPIKITPDTHRANLWHFSLANKQPRINLELLNILQQTCDLNVEPLLKHNDFSKKGLLDWLNELESQVGFEWQNRQIALAKTPSIQDLDNLPVNGELFWSGVIGNCPSSFVIPFKDFPALSNQAFETEDHPFGLLKPTAEQEAVFQNGRSKKLSAITGKAGSGKTYTTTHAITNALANNKKVLVVSDAIPSLFEIQKLLAQFDIPHLNFLLQSPKADEGLLLELLKAAAANTENKYPFDQDTYDKWLERGVRLYKKYNQPFQQAHRKIFGNDSWTETVGLFLRNERQQSKVLLASQLTATDFEFTETEYKVLEEAISKSKTIFEKIQTLNHPLIQVHPRFFTDMELVDAELFLKEQTDRLLDRTTQLHQRYINKSQAYNDRLFRFLESQYQRLFQHKTKLTEIIAENTNQFGDDYLNASNSSLRLKGIFSSKAKEITQAKEETFEQYDRIVNAFQQNIPFDFVFPLERELKQVANLSAFIPKFSEALEQYRLQIPSLVQEDMARLNHKTVVESLGFKDQMEELEQALDRLVENINTARLFRGPLKSQMLTIPKRQKHLEAIIDRIENIQFNLRDFKDFYVWQRHWLSLSEEARKVVKSLIKVKVQNWEAAFNSWYFNNSLLRNYSPLLPDQEVNLKNLAHQIEQAPRQLVNKIKFSWHQEKEVALKQFKREHKNLYQQIFSKKNQELTADLAFEDWFGTGIEAISSVIPIIMTSPDLAYQCFKTQSEVFDLVIVDEAQELDVSMGRFLNNIGKRTILTHFLSSAKTNLLDELNSVQMNFDRLETTKRYYPGNPFQAPNIDDQYNQNIQFDQVDGRYDENKKINEVEAQHVIRILNQIQKTPQQTYPKVGIACFTIEQRNFIFEYLQDIRKRINQGGEKIKQLERNGLGVYQIKELYGQHFDILIISTTFGPIDLDGNLTSHIDELNHADGEKWIQILASRAIQKLFFTTSIPEDVIQHLYSQKEYKGTYALSNFYKFNQLSNNNQMAKQAVVIRDLLDDDSKKKSLYGKTFAEEVAQAILPYLAGRQIKTNIQEEGHHFPILIEPQEDHQSAVVCKLDGFWNHLSYTNFKSEFDYDQLLTQSGYHVLSVWSSAWWKSPDEEARKLASAILKLN